MNFLSRVLAALSVASVVSVAQAQSPLQARPGGMVYDPQLDVTWLADMNFAATTGHDPDGLMTWSAAVAWADALTHGGYADWRLPDVGTGSTAGDNELHHLFVTSLGYDSRLGRETFAGANAVQVANAALFSNLGFSLWYAIDGGRFGAQDTAYAYLSYGMDHILWLPDAPASARAIALRDGDVAAPIPEPSTYALMLAGLSCLAMARRRRAKSP